MEEPEEKNPLIKHLQTILVSVCTVAILFAATFTVGTSRDLALLTQSVANLSTQVASMQSKLESMQLNYVTRSEFRDHEDRIRNLEQRKK